ncbi:MAG: rod shape-determining protein MreC, partial [Acidimicrobiia bacterium]|nr:rod shape-determining protein MreC [Acidimicrobiia bacterium]
VLVRENEEFRARIQEVSRLELENEQLRALLDLESQLELETIPIVADVTGATEDGGLLIAKGTADGVVIGMPVLNESQLLIGRVVQATEQQAVAELLIDATDAVVVDTPEGVTGVVTGTGRVGELRLSVEFGALYVPEGTVFTTAGFGLPRGLQVGFAEEELVPLGDTIIDARITPFADFSRLPRFVLIVPILERPGDDLGPEEPVEGEEETPVEEDADG